MKTINACKQIAQFTNAPFHVGITEAGGGKNGIIKSTAGIGILIYEGLADTFRVSLTAPIEEEIKTGFSILKAMGKLENGGEIISCPTCGRTHGTLFKYYNKLEKWFNNQNWWQKPRIKVALMGCEVNGPGEASDANIGLALGHNTALFFENGEIKKKFDSQDKAFEELLKKIEEKWKN
jgi:(E)-4-hydroxy-3-methylbut-2-enyl-diphosphate synthase